jgi:hypothetical protein
MKRIATMQDYPLVHHVVWVVNHIFKWGKQTPLFNQIHEIMGGWRVHKMVPFSS